MSNPAIFEVEAVVMLTEFWDVQGNSGVHKYRYHLTASEWRAYLRAHRLCRLIPFTCAADFMSEDLESLVCGHAPERYTKIQEPTGKEQG